VPDALWPALQDRIDRIHRWHAAERARRAAGLAPVTMRQRYLAETASKGDL